MAERQHAVKLEPRVHEQTSAEEASASLPPPKFAVLADLNVDPPVSDGDDPLFIPSIAPLIADENSQSKCIVVSKEPDVVETEGKKFSKLRKCRSRIIKIDCSIDYGVEAELDQHSQGTPSSREEKISSLKTGLVHVARNMPKNAHTHFILGLLYQRMGQRQKVVLVYEKAAKILHRPETEIDRQALLLLVQIHHAQCILLESSGDNSSDNELEHDEQIFGWRLCGIPLASYS